MGEVMIKMWVWGWFAAGMSDGGKEPVKSRCGRKRRKGCIHGYHGNEPDMAYA